MPFGPVSSDGNDNVSVLSSFGSPTVFNYELNNRATGISGPSISAQMKYFGDGKLAELSAGSGTSRYLEDPSATGNRILADLDGSGNVQRAYIHGLGMVSVLDGPSTYYYVHNLQGSTVALTDGMGSVLASHRYDPFGRTIQTTGNDPYPFAFLGRYSVPTVGSYSITTFRLYNANDGRFTGPDPAHWNLSPAISPFLYAGQSPINMVDPSGLWSWTNPLSFLDPIVDKTTNAINGLADNPTAIQGANLVVCNFTYTLAASHCKKAGLTDNDIAIVQTVDNVSLAAITFGGSAAVSETAQTASMILTKVGYVSDVFKYGPDVLRLTQGKLSPEEQVNLMKELSLELLSVGTDLFVSEYSDVVGKASARALTCNINTTSWYSRDNCWSECSSSLCIAEH